MAELRARTSHTAAARTDVRARERAEAALERRYVFHPIPVCGVHAGGLTCVALARIFVGDNDVGTSRRESLPFGSRRVDTVCLTSQSVSLVRITSVRLSTLNLQRDDDASART